MGLVAYGRAIRQQLPFGKGSAHLLTPSNLLPWYTKKSLRPTICIWRDRLRTAYEQRSPVVWLTDLAETAMTPGAVR